MGSCMGRCFPKSESSSSSCYHNRNLFSDQENEFHFLVEDSDASVTIPEPNRNTFMSRLLSRKKNRYKYVKKPVLELVEGFWSTSSDSSYSRLNKNPRKVTNPSLQQGRGDIPLQCLDVRALLSRNGAPTTSSTPVSSLDLEWEHETLPISMHDPSLNSWAVLPEENLPELSVSEGSTTRQAGHSICSDWSRVSSADSLEWDPVQSPLHCTPPGSIDADTQQLLNEIERLTDQALRETGSGLNS